MAATGENVSERYKQEHKQIMFGDYRQLMVSASYGFPVTWTEGAKRTTFAGVELANVISHSCCEVHKTSCYSVVECQNKLICEHTPQHFVCPYAHTIAFIIPLYPVPFVTGLCSLYTYTEKTSWLF